MPFIKVSSIKLTKREFEIMNILWENKSPMIASEIAKHGDKLTINTVQALLKKLISKKYIEVADIVYSGTVLCRSYRPTLTADEYEMNKMIDSYNKINDHTKGMSRFVATLLEEEKNKTLLLSEIEELEVVLKEKKESLKTKN